jgi:DNA-binding transcriptional ArsR family regulator
MVTLPPIDVTALRSIKKTAILILVLVRLRTQPATAKDLASILDMDYQTTRTHLASLAALGLTLETPTGWIASQQTFHLLSTTPVDNAIISRSEPLLKDSSSTSAHIPLLEEEEEEEEGQERDKTALSVDQRMAQIETATTEESTRVWNSLYELQCQGLHIDHKLIDLI